MAFTEVQSLDAEITIALGGTNKKTGKKNPTTAEGYYLGSRKVENKTGESSIHFLQTSKGNLGIWGKTDLDRKLTAVVPGTMVRLNFTGMQATPRGDMYKFKVEVDADNSIDVSGLASSNSSSSTEDQGLTEDGNEDYNEAADYEDEEVEAQEAVSTVTLSAAQRRDKVQQLLKGKR